MAMMSSLTVRLIIQASERHWFVLWSCCSQFPGALQKLSATKRNWATMSLPQDHSSSFLPAPLNCGSVLPLTQQKNVHVLFCHLWPIYPSFCFIITSLQPWLAHTSEEHVTRRRRANWSKHILTLNAQLLMRWLKD